MFVHTICHMKYLPQIFIRIFFFAGLMSSLLLLLLFYIILLNQAIMKSIRYCMVLISNLAAMTLTG